MKTELVFIPVPATGHLVSIVQLAKLLVARDEDLSIRFLIFKLPYDTIANSYIQSLCAETTRGIQYVELADPLLPQIDSVSKPQNPIAFLFRLIESQKPQVRDAVSQLKESGSASLAGFVVDMFCVALIDVANEFQMPTFVFYPSGAAMIGLRNHILSLIDDHCDLTQYKDSEFEFSVSTYINPVPAKLFPSRMFDQNGQNLEDTRRLISETKGIIVNTFLELESYAMQALTSNQKMPTIYPVGPLISLNGIKNNQEDRGTILRWLDDQPVSSVVFFCFGSFGSFEGDQVKEIAYAIERSGCRFLWSLRRPPPKERIEFPGEYENHEQVLPAGFLERTSRVGKVIGWAPQAQVLAHPAVGGFVTHCGWNSVLESVWFGVPMATWPMYAEQQMNAFLLVKDLGIAAEIRMDYKKDIMNSTTVTVPADEIEGGIRKLMQPESGMRKKVKELMEKARTAFEEGGSSYISLGRFMEDFHGSHQGSHGWKVKETPTPN